MKKILEIIAIVVFFQLVIFKCVTTPTLLEDLTVKRDAGTLTEEERTLLICINLKQTRCLDGIK